MATLHEHGDCEFAVAWKRINDVDLSMVIKKMGRNREWRRNQAEEPTMQNRRILFI